MAQQKKIAVLVSGGGTNLQALIDAEKRGELGAGKITLVIASKPGVYALERAANAGIEGRVLARKDYDSIAAYSKALADEMTAADIDLVVLAGFLTIIDEQVYEAFPNRIINVSSRGTLYTNFLLSVWLSIYALAKSEDCFPAVILLLVLIKSRYSK